MSVYILSAIYAVILAASEFMLLNGINIGVIGYINYFLFSSFAFFGVLGWYIRSRERQSEKTGKGIGAFLAWIGILAAGAVILATVGEAFNSKDMFDLLGEMFTYIFINIAASCILMLVTLLGYAASCLYHRKEEKGRFRRFLENPVAFLGALFLIPLLLLLLSAPLNGIKELLQSAALLAAPMTVSVLASAYGVFVVSKKSKPALMSVGYLSVYIVVGAALTVAMVLLYCGIEQTSISELLTSVRVRNVTPFLVMCVAMPPIAVILNAALRFTKKSDNKS